MAEYHLERGTDIHRDIYINTVCKTTVLSRAASAGYFPAVQWLHERGAEINFPVHGKPASLMLIGAAMGGHLDVVEYLVGHGALGDCSEWTRPDGEVVEVMAVTPLYTSERDYELAHGLPDLLEKVSASLSGVLVWPGRDTFMEEWEYSEAARAGGDGIEE